MCFRFRTSADHRLLRSESTIIVVAKCASRSAENRAEHLHENRCGTIRIIFHTRLNAMMKRSFEKSEINQFSIH